MSDLFAAFGLQLPLLIAQAVNFGVLMTVLWYLLYKPVMATIEKRRALVAQGVEDAELAAAKLASADEEASSVIHSAESEAEGIVSVARESAQSERARIVSEAEARAASVEKDAQARAKEDAARALRDSEKEIARLAILAAEKVVRSK